MPRLFLPVRTAVTAANNHLQRRILFITDAEGNRSFFESAIAGSSTVKNTSHGLQFLPQPKAIKPHFIYGGDAVDRGPHDLWLLEKLVRFKELFPDQVTLIAGNRDINKGRFCIELDPKFIRQRLIANPPAAWLAATVHPRNAVIEEMKKRGIPAAQCNAITIQQFIDQLSIQECQLLYLRWMLKETMGCPYTFEYRRQELSAQSQGNITDEEVLASFLTTMEPGGLQEQYLHHAQVAAIVPDTNVLTIHGALTAANIGLTPDMPDDAARISSLDKYVAQLNHWYQRELAFTLNFKSQQLTPPGFTPLDRAYLPIAGLRKNPTTADWLGPQREFQTLSPAVTSYLANNGIQAVLTGHQPTGNQAMILRADNTTLILNGDTGYSQVNPQNPHDTRGNISHTLELLADKQQTQVSVQAHLATAQPTSTHLFVDKDGIHGDAYIGKILSDGRLVQCQLAADQYGLIRQQGFRVEYSTASKEELTHILSESSICKRAM